MILLFFRFRFKKEGRRLDASCAKNVLEEQQEQCVTFFVCVLYHNFFLRFVISPHPSLLLVKPTRGVLLYRPVKEANKRKTNKKLHTQNRNTIQFSTHTIDRNTRRAPRLGPLPNLTTHTHRYTRRQVSNLNFIDSVSI